MLRPRQAGILCHPTSMPSPYGIGDLGQGTLRFIDYVQSAHMTLWQVLPLGPTGFGDSPYQPFSAFAGNHLLIDPQQLVADGLLTQADLAADTAADAPFDPDRVDYGRVMGYKDGLLRRAYAALRRGQGAALEADWRAYESAQAEWLPDYCLFMALKRRFEWRSWADWPREIALRQPEALAYWRETLADEIAQQSLSQFLFDRQWLRVRAYANAAGITIIGDMPIFVGHDSADVWSHRELFTLDADGQPTVIAGVPPDYFSPTGQRWGNPHYRWGPMRETGYAWWLARLRRALAQVDRVRLDHFRGFAGYWEVPAAEETAMNGRWVIGPGADFFQAVERELGVLPIIAEDLGLITEDVDALRKQCGLPGMRVLQFAFDGDPANHHLPHNYTPDSVVYSGTHDNDTTLGWYRAAPDKTRNHARVYAGSDGHAIHWDFIRLAMTSCADMAILPLQDVLGLGSEARLNAPGVPHGNWTWRYRQEMLAPGDAAALAALADVTGRWLPPAGEVEAEPPTVIEYEEPAE